MEKIKSVCATYFISAISRKVILKRCTQQKRSIKCHYKALRGPPNDSSLVLLAQDQDPGFVWFLSNMKWCRAASVSPAFANSRKQILNIFLFYVSPLLLAWPKII